MYNSTAHCNKNPRKNIKEWDKNIPPSNRSIKRESNKILARIGLVGLNPQSFLLQINIVPDGDRLLMLHIGCGWLHHWPARVTATDPIDMGRVHAVVVIVWSR